MSNWGLVTGDWGLGDVRYQISDIRRQTLLSSFRARREIFVICGQAVDFDSPKMGNPLSPVLCARHYVYLAAPLIFAPHLPC